VGCGRRRFALSWIMATKAEIEPIFMASGTAENLQLFVYAAAGFAGLADALGSTADRKYGLNPSP
jgi:hypothetical protein